MKALSVVQPYPSWIAAGIKTIETRTWKTDFRGRILICASMTKQIIPSPFWQAVLQGHEFPKGVALCTAEILDCRPMTTLDQALACCEYYEGAFSWVLGNVRRVNQFHVKGALGLFNVDWEEGDLMADLLPPQLSLFK